MESLKIIQEFLDKGNIENNIELLPNGNSILNIKYKGKISDHWICAEEPSEDSKQVIIYSIVAKGCKEAKCNICRIINGYNKKYDYVKFFYQESEQGEYVFASYCIPSLKSGLQFYFGKVFLSFISILDEVTFSVPQMVFNGQIKTWYFADDE